MDTFDEIKLITFTGNRGIEMNNPDVNKSLSTIKQMYPKAIWRTGMAYGLDMAIAKWAFDNNVHFEAHLPFPAHVQTKKWRDSAKELHAVLLTKAIKVFTHSNHFSFAAYQNRNVKMATGANIVIAFNLNNKGGTVNMIRYCLKSKITVLDGFNNLTEVENI